MIVRSSEMRAIGAKSGHCTDGAQQAVYHGDIAAPFET